MKIKPPRINIPKDNPFAEDALGRDESVVVLTQLVSTIGEPFVLAVDSPWGTGKTTFLRMWHCKLKNEGYPCLYFNAWENDFSDDPLVSLIGEIESGLDSIVPDVKTKRKAKEHFKKAKKVGSALVKGSLPVAIKLATGLDVEKISEKVLKDLSENLADEMIKKYERDKSAIENFRQRLEAFVEVLGGNGEEKKPLMLFVDELDRCRPTFALELLEKAKHFFNIEGIIFVLAMDKQQIGHSIKSIYGTGMDVDGYLRRFIDLDYHLPEPNSEAFCNALFNKFGFDKYFQERGRRDARNERSRFLQMFSNLSTMFGFSLRVQEQCFSQLSIVLRTTPTNNKIYPLFLAFLIALKAANKNLYKKYIKRTADVKQILNYLKKVSEDKTFIEEYYWWDLEAYLVYGQNPGNDIDFLAADYLRIVNDEKTSEEQKYRANSIISKIRSLIMDLHYDILTYLVKKIEIAEQFVSS